MQGFGLVVDCVQRQGVGPDAITWEGGGVCFDPDAGLWPSGRLSSAPMCRQSFP